MVETLKISQISRPFFPLNNNWETILYWALAFLGHSEMPFELDCLFKCACMNTALEGSLSLWSKGGDTVHQKRCRLPRFWGPLCVEALSCPLLITLWKLWLVVLARKSRWTVSTSMKNHSGLEEGSDFVQTTLTEKHTHTEDERKELAIAVVRSLGSFGQFAGEIIGQGM